jgi:hypothetical protein
MTAKRSTAGLIRLVALLILVPGLFSLTSCEKKAAVTPVNTTKVAPSYSLGTAVTFGAGGSGLPYLLSGWSNPEADFTWSNSSPALLLMNVDVGGSALRLSLTINGFKKDPELPEQPVEVRANGTSIAHWNVGDTADFAATIPASALRDDHRLQIEFVIPKAASPKSLSVSNDDRTLGLALRKLVISKTE